MAASALGFEFQRRAVRLCAAAPVWLMRAVAGKPIEVDGQTLDPQVQFLMKLFADKPGTLASVDETRFGFDNQGSWLSQPATQDVATEELRLAGPEGVIPARLYRPAGLTYPAPAMVFYHGGGHAAGSIESHDLPCRALARDAKCLVIAVGYRLAPEHKFPAGVEDGIAAFREIATLHGDLGIDASRIAVGGDSAGGNLAAVVAQQTRNDEIRPFFQMLWVPWVDMTSQSRSYELFDLGFFLEKPKMEWYTDHYLADKQHAFDPRASPILGEVEGVAPAAVLVAGFDPLRDEGEAYARKLEAAGVKVTLRRFSNLPHPFINLAGYVTAAMTAFDEATALLRSAFEARHENSGS